MKINSWLSWENRHSSHYLQVDYWRYLFVLSVWNLSVSYVVDYCESMWYWIVAFSLFLHVFFFCQKKPPQLFQIKCYLWILSHFVAMHWKILRLWHCFDYIASETGSAFIVLTLWMMPEWSRWINRYEAYIDKRRAPIKFTRVTLNISKYIPRILTFSCLKKHNIFSSRKTRFDDTSDWNTFGSFFSATRLPSRGSVTAL